jgi:hypothetical protein
MQPSIQQEMSAALDRLWVQFLPQMNDRLGILESACNALAAGMLSTDQRLAANGAAHKLAGVLGTFGLTRGTVLAREVEVFYSGETQSDPAAAGRLSEINTELRTMIAARSQVLA